MSKRGPVPVVRGVFVAGQLPKPAADENFQTFRLDNLEGRLVEVSGAADTATLTMVARLILEAQARAEPVAWISTQDSVFYPPDLWATGIDLGALPVVRVQPGRQVARAADALLRSGSFALVVLDLGRQASMTLSVQTRLAGLARKNRTVLVAITRADRKKAALGSSSLGPSSLGSSSLGSLVSLLGVCSRKRTAFQHFTCELHVCKDKRAGTGWRHLELCRGPDGLC